MYFSWLEDINERNITLRNQACLIGSFWNPEAARKIMNAENSEENIKISDEEFDKVTEMMLSENRKEDKKRKRKRKLIFKE